MTRIPMQALALGLAGLLPFLWSAATLLVPGLALWSSAHLPPMFIGTYVALNYGTIILSFMSGVLWGFATRAKGWQAALAYALSVIPALWAFFMVTDGSPASLISLAAGYAGLLMLDASFAAQGLAPPWWMRLRLVLTAVVLACLAVPILRG